MNNTLIIGIAIIAILGVGALLLTGDREPISTGDDLAGSDELTQQPQAPEDAPPAPAEGDMTDPTETVTPPDPETIVDLAADNQELATFTNVVQVAGLTEILAAEGPYTVLAPNEDAFAAVPEEALAELTAPENIEELQSVLALHVIAGIITSDDLEDGMTLTTLAGEELTVSIDANGAVTIGGATVIGADVTADNGVIHIVDTVVTEAA